jgi:hypothetical protein
MIALILQNYSDYLMPTYFPPTLYVYVRLTNVINLFLWLMCFLCLPSLPHFFVGSSVGSTFAVCVSAKVPFPIERN